MSQKVNLLVLTGRLPSKAIREKGELHTVEINRIFLSTIAGIYIFIFYSVLI